MPVQEQVLWFAVGSASGPRSRTWRLWVPQRKSDVYISSRRLGSSVKVSLHESGRSRCALTTEWVRRAGFQAPEGRDPRLAVQWERPRPRPPREVARPFSIIVPWDEVIDRGTPETGQVVWIPPPPEGTCIHVDLIYIPAGAVVTGHPGARSMGTGLVGEVKLENEERVFVTCLVRAMDEATRLHIVKLRSAPIIDADGNPIEKAGMLDFGTQPNPDTDDGTYVGTFLDVTRKPSAVPPMSTKLMMPNHPLQRTRPKSCGPNRECSVANQRSLTSPRPRH